MAHAITQRQGGFSEMAYVGEKPWHGLGQELKAGRPIEEWLTAAGMDWKVQRSKVRYATHAGGVAVKEWADYHVLMRDDTKAPLGMVSKDYKVVQPRQVLEFFRDLTEVAGFQLKTAGTLFGGSRFWAMASINAEEPIFNGDLVKGNLLFATSLDHSLKNTIKNVTECVVCANTLAIAMGEKGAPQVEVSHRSEFNEAEVKARLGVSVDSFHRFIADAKRLAARKVKEAEAEHVMDEIFEYVPPKNSTEEKERSFPERKILQLFNDAESPGATLQGRAGTAWGLLNATTYYVDHLRKAHSQSNRVFNAWFGSGDDLKQKASKKIMELVA